MELRKILNSEETRLNLYYPNPEGGNTLVATYIQEKKCDHKEGEEMEFREYGTFVVRNRTIIPSREKMTYMYDAYLKE
jgi:hypothetical protein